MSESEKESNSVKPAPYRWKNKLVTKKMYHALLKRVENGKNSWKKSSNGDVDKANPKLKKVVEGSRVIDVGFLQEQLRCFKCKKPSLLRNIQGESRRGLASIFKVRCENCSHISSVNTYLQYKNPASGKSVSQINTKAVLGV